MSETSKRIRELAEPLASSLGVILWGVDVQVGSRSTVRVFVEKDGGVSIDDCAELSRLLGLTLEVEDVIENAYVLEVSSPGLERTFFTLEQLASVLGKKVELALFSALPDFPGRRKYSGFLQSVEGENICIMLEDASLIGEIGETITVSWDKVKKARQIYVEPEKILPGKRSSKKNSSKKKENSEIKEGFSAEDAAL